MAIETLNISSIIIRLRLQYVGGSDEVAYSSWIMI